tara:strand:+ start:420 stop:665 length:246 start_codon:yes stop_codon:yes gene_type:complete
MTFLKASDEVVILTYLNYRKFEGMGHLKYSNFCAVFCYILNNYNKDYVRKIFIKLVRNGHFDKKQNVKRSYTYKFIPFLLD